MCSRLQGEEHQCTNSVLEVVCEVVMKIQTNNVTTMLVVEAINVNYVDVLNFVKKKLNDSLLDSKNETDS